MRYINPRSLDLAVLRFTSIFFFFCYSAQEWQQTQLYLMENGSAEKLPPLQIKFFLARKIRGAVGT